MSCSSTTESKVESVIKDVTGSSSFLEEKETYENKQLKSMYKIKKEHLSEKALEELKGNWVGSVSNNIIYRYEKTFKTKEKVDKFDDHDFIYKGEFIRVKPIESMDEVWVMYGNITEDYEN